MHKLNGYFLKHHLINKKINNNRFTSISVIKYQIAEVSLYLNIKLLKVSLYSKIKLLKVSLYCISKIWIWIRISLRYRVRKDNSFSDNLATCWDIQKNSFIFIFKISWSCEQYLSNFPCCKVVSDKLYLRWTLRQSTKPNIAKDFAKT